MGSRQRATLATTTKEDQMIYGVRSREEMDHEKREKVVFGERKGSP